MLRVDSGELGHGGCTFGCVLDILKVLLEVLVGNFLGGALVALLLSFDLLFDNSFLHWSGRSGNHSRCFLLSGSSLLLDSRGLSGGSRSDSLLGSAGG